MTKQQKITLSASRDLPFNKLMLSQSNVRHVKADVSIEELAEDIARRTLLSSITVRPVLDDNGAETGMYTIPAGGRRFRALELLVKQTRMNKTALVPCIVRTDGLAEEDSLAENVQRAPLHPLDQFRAFQAMREKGRTEEEIAAAFFVSASVVKQRLKLAAVAPSLLDAYAEEAMTLDQLMAFTVNPDHARQEQVWEAVQRHYSRQPCEIRRMLTEGAVRATDKRARFVGLDNYVEAGGEILRDLFQQDDGGWLQDAALLDVMVREKLSEEAETVHAEGWKWVEVDTEFPYGHTFGMRRVHGEAVPMSDEEAASYQALKTEYDALEADEARPIRFEAEDLALAGAFVSIDSSGRLRVERGYVRPEDEPVEEVEDTGEVAREAAPVEDSDNTVASASDEEEEDDGLKPLSDRLVMELTAHRTLALRNALAQDPQVAFLAALHAMVMRLFYRYAVDSCVEIEPRNAGFGSQVPGLGDTAYAQAIDQRHETWARNLPKAPEDLWDALTEFDSCSREALFAHCVAMSVNAVHDPYQRRPRAIARADVLAGIVRLDMAKAGWTATGDSYLGRVTKARILEAVREAKGEDAADRIAGLKKAEMVTAAEDLLVGTGWLPDPLRTPPLPEEDAPEIELIDDADTGEAQSAEDGGEPAIGDSDPTGEDDPVAGDAFARTAAE
ncbi:ParB N-terminal domain-containing protein [Tropicimonas sp. IMCC34043]|uniref:ParB/RepB/Spo0J family partition protein n=1 Tax=Tropicimonas sp. IMCC34043 TaxID=2248760 RepID=UPI000E279956|nr:ParB N-terminal domain-containing protein [Tropicimonas sp. IMCC34043]